MSMNRICMQAMRQLNVHPRGFSLFSLGGREEDGFFLNSWVSIMLLSCSHIFPRFPMCASRILPITPHFIPYPLPKVFPFSPVYTWAKEELLMHRNCYFGEPPKFLFLCVRGQSKWPIVKKKIRIREAAHLMKTWVCLGLGILLYRFSKFWKFPDFRSL